MDKDFFVLTYSADINDITIAFDAGKNIKEAFPDKEVIVMPDVITLKRYDKKALIELLNFYIIYVKGLTNE